MRDLGEVGGEADPSRGHQEHLMVQMGVLGARADLLRDFHRADRGPRPQEPHRAGDTASVEAGDRQREAARDPVLLVIECPDQSEASIRAD